jgi:RNA polymerase sigma-70 factor, ECF subfamily
VNFTELYRRHAPDVFRFALYLSGDRTEADEITAETFARAWASPSTVRMATVKGYLLTIARNYFLQSRRGRARQVPLDEALPDPRAAPHARAEIDSELRAAMAALQRLPEIDRAALLMRAADELPYEEIARALGITLSAAKVKVHRARLSLARIRDESQRLDEPLGEVPSRKERR